MREYIHEAIAYMFFHGAEWYLCPHCRFRFEIAQADREECGIKKAKEKDAYIFPECKKKFRIV